MFNLFKYSGKLQRKIRTWTFDFKIYYLWDWQKNGLLIGGPATRELKDCLRVLSPATIATSAFFAT